MINSVERNLLVTSYFSAFSQGLLGPLFAVFSQRIGGSVMDISAAWATYLFMTGILVFLVGHWSNGCSRRRKLLMVVGYYLNAALYFSYIVVAVPAHLLFVQAGLGIAVSMTNPTWSSLLTEYVEKDRVSFVWGLASGGFFVLTGTALLFGGYLVQYFSFGALFAVMGTSMLLAAINAHRIFWLPTTQQSSEQAPWLVERTA